MYICTKFIPMFETIALENVTARICRFETESEVVEFHLMLSVDNPLLSYDEQLEALMHAYHALTQKELRGATAVFKRYFLSDAYNQTDGLMNYELESADSALSIVQQAPLNGTKIALWAWLMTNVQAKALPGGLYEVSHGEFRHLWLASANNKAKDSERQTRILFNDYVMQLIAQGCSLSENCIRTWFFVNDVDLNYAGVVKARNEVFVTQGLTDKTHYIASTGIGGRQADAHVLSQMDAYAVAGIHREQVKHLYAPTHLNRTSDYGVSFERGTMVDYADRRHVFISGTASINNKGEIMYVGDVRSQCHRMWENVGMLLKEADCTFDDVTQMIVYLRDMADYTVVSRLYEDRFPDTPRVFVHAKVCRPGWLIEMECMAVKKQQNDSMPKF